MAGRPKRREREARQRAGKRFDTVAREAILKRAGEIGAGDAAREAGVSPATLRTWRHRMKGEPDDSLEPQVADEASAADKLRLKAEDMRAMSVRAFGAADRLLAGGLASEGRNAATTAAILGDRAGEMERAADEAEAHQI